MILQSMYEAQQLNFTLAWRHSNSIKGICTCQQLTQMLDANAAAAALST